MADAGEHIRRWRDAGLIDEALAERLTAFEADAGAGAAPAPEMAGSERPGLVEVLLYLGLAVAGVGVFIFVAMQWDEMRAWVRLTLVAVPATLTLAAGAAMNTSGEAGVRRGGHVAWLLAVALVAGTLAVALNEYGPDNQSDASGTIWVVIGAVALAAAVTLWALSPSNPQVLAVGGAAFFFGETLGAWPGDYSPRIAGVAIMVSGIVMVTLVELRRFRPRLTAAPLGALLVGGGAYHAGIDSPVTWELLAFVAAGALLALGVWRGSFAYVVIGVGTLLAALITFMFVHFENEISAPLALMLSGGLIVAAVLVLVQVRNLVRSRRARA